MSFSRRGSASILLAGGLVVFNLAFAVPADSQTTTAAKKDANQSWAYSCQAAGITDKPQCRIMQNLTVNKGDQQQRLLTVIVREQAKAKNHALLLALPHGLFLPAGVEIKVDQDKPAKLIVQTSDAQGAYAGIEISDELLAALKKGNQMSVSFLSAARKRISVPVTLKGFTAAYGKLKTAE